MKAILPPDWEEKQVELAKKALDDIPVCRSAEYCVRWIDDPCATNYKVPVLQISFPQFGFTGEEGGCPALGIRLTGTSGKILEGDKFRSGIRRITENFLTKNGVRIAEDTEQEENLIVIG